MHIRLVGSPVIDSDYWTRLASFEIEHWSDHEEDTRTALGEPHYFHLVELVARRVTLD